MAYVADPANNRVRKVDLPGFPTLALANVGATNAGDYTVVIASPYGNVMNTVATLTVTIPPAAPLILVTNESFGLVSNQFGFNLSGVVGQGIIAP